jgi:hypothetical protein
MFLRRRGFEKLDILQLVQGGGQWQYFVKKNRASWFRSSHF